MDVPFHGEAVGMLFVVPVNVDTVILGSFPVRGDGVVIFESGEKVFGVAFLHILNSEIVDYE